jgi:eukaryotic-like serine/threonine-protein kinase
VVPTSEVRRLKVTDPSAALSQLGATMVVKGSTARDGQDVRLNVSLIDTKDLRQLGSANLEDRAGDFATLQNEAISQLARLMNIDVTADNAAQHRRFCDARRLRAVPQREGLHSAV